MNAKPYTALICPPGALHTGRIGSRITGSIARQLAPAELRRLRATLAAGQAIQVVTASRATWLATRADLLAQIGGAL